MNEPPSKQFQIDFLTGASTGFNSRVVLPDEWRAIDELNRKRSRSLKAIHGQSASWREVSPDVWAQKVPEQAGLLDVPVVDLLALGIDADEFGELISLVPELERLDSGKEAVAWLHRTSECVYKLFDLGPEGDLGQRLAYEPEEQGNCRVIYENAELPDILDKLELLHRIGGCPTEIVGLASRGDYLLAKQPFCGPHGPLDEDRRRAVENAKAVAPHGSLGDAALALRHGGRTLGPRRPAHWKHSPPGGQRSGHYRRPHGPHSTSPPTKRTITQSSSRVGETSRGFARKSFECVSSDL